MSSLSESVTGQLTARLATVCPQAPPGADGYVDQITGYIMWGVLAIIGAAGLVAVGAVVGGRLFNMPHASKTGIIAAVVVFMGAIGYMVFPGMLSGVTGSGCL